MEFWSESFDSLSEHERWTSGNHALLAFRRAAERQLQDALPPHHEKIYPGYCFVCDRHSQLIYDWEYSLPGRINWRERLVCKGCGLSNRLRLSLHLFESVVDNHATASVYLTEQVSPLAAALRKRCKNLACSEFLGADKVGGRTSAEGLRHEDLTRLSFSDKSFDAVLCFDVLEHVPNYRMALAEVRRVLRPGGHLVASAPFMPRSQSNVLRATVALDGTVQHLLPPEFHGDPVNPTQGILCFHNFGWDFLDDLRNAGFSKATIRFSWSTDYAYIGHEQPVFLATA